MCRNKIIPLNTKKSEPNKIKLHESKNIEVKLDFRYFIYKQFKYKDFTNIVKTEDEYYKVMDSLYRNFIPYCDSKNINEIQIENKHNHYIKDEEKYKHNTKVFHIIKECERLKLTNINTSNIDTEGFYQLYTPNGIRTICYLYETTFYVLFIDPHHLIYPDERYNKDYENYTYCPKLIDEIDIIRFEYDLDECYNCDALNKIINN